MEPWGKYGKYGYDAEASPYPLVAHLLDTAAVALAQWDVWISDQLQKLVTPLFECGPREGFAMLAGAHDLGKIDPIFQGQLLAAQSDDRFAPFVAEQPVPSDQLIAHFRKYSATLKRHLRHEALSGYMLHQRNLPKWASASVAGHHGRYQSDEGLIQTARIQRYRANVATTGKWLELQEQHFQVLYETLGVTPRDFKNHLDSKQGAVIPILTGLVTLADWLASDERFIASAPIELITCPSAYLQERQLHAIDAVSKQLGRPATKEGDFKELFGFDANRPVQSWAKNAEHIAGLTIITVPAGEGKTETALWMHSAGAGLNEGLMFALPTTATADAMFGRVQSFYQGTDALAHLAHGRAILNAFYSTSTAKPTSICDDGQTSDGGLRPSSWFTGRHRGTTAPVTVGTCDQVLAASVSHKFLPVRLASLANKHVILDEIHTYDPYQQQLLIRLLGWLGFCHSRVTLLSATLPRQRIVECTDAYLQGWNRFPDEQVSIGSTLDFQYPGIVRTTADGGVQVEQFKSYREYTHNVEVMTVHGIDEGFNQAVAKLAHQSWNAETCRRVGVIVNTVDHAQQVTRLLREMGHDVLILHSRMTATQRAQATQELLDQCGKDASGGSVILVSTQIAEASLDIDLDLLITEVAPMASLIQRLGRQWRHSDRGTDGIWRHPEHLNYRSGNPTAFIIVSVGDNDELHDRAHYPYTRAEILKTLGEVSALDEGRRKQFQIPDDVQSAVDAANVSWDDLVEHEGESLAELFDHLAKLSSSNQSAALAGVDASSLANSWRDDSDAWEDNSTLFQLTRGTLWNDEAVTRLQEAATLQLIVCDQDGTNSLAWPDTPESILTTKELAQVKEILRYVIPVSGVLAVRLGEIANQHMPSGWNNQRYELLRSVCPISIKDLSQIAELSELGLVNKETGSK